MGNNFKEFLGGSKNPKLIWEKIKYDYCFLQEHPDFFAPSGFICFCGGQGNGKTLSAVSFIHKIVQEYPDVQLVANCALQFPDWNGKVLKYQGYEQVQKLDNGYKGIILFLDEIQSEFNSLESRRIDPSWFTVISQQRKRRLLVVGTAQVFNRVAKCWREQFTACIVCRGWFDFVQWNSIVCLDDIEEDDKGDVQSYKTRDSRIWFRDPALFDYYDTWERVERKETAKNDNK